MQTQLIETNGVKILECLPDGGTIASEDDALELVGLCGEHLAERLLLSASNLAEDFYFLRSGLAGAVLLKFTNYHIRAAAVLAPLRAAAEAQGRADFTPLWAGCRADACREIPAAELTRLLGAGWA